MGVLLRGCCCGGVVGRGVVVEVLLVGVLSWRCCWWGCGCGGVVGGVVGGGFVVEVLLVGVLLWRCC